MAKGYKAAWAGLGLTFLTFILAFCLPEKIPSVVVPLLGLSLMRTLAEMVYGSALREHRARGGALASSLKVAGIGILFGLVLVGAFFAGALGYAFLTEGKHCDYSPNEQVFYRNGATEEEARQLGSSLHDEGFFSGQGAATVYLEHSKDSYRVGFVMQEKGLADPKTAEVLAGLGQDLSKKCFHGSKVQVGLYDESGELKKELNP